MTASFATQISNDNMRFASDGGTVVTGVAPDRQRQDVRSSVGEGVRRRTTMTLGRAHMRPPMAVPASAEIDEPLWPELRNMEGQDGFYPYRMSEALNGSYNIFSSTGRVESSNKLMLSCRLGEIKRRARTS